MLYAPTTEHEEVMRLFFKLDHNVVLRQYSATCCQYDSAEAHRPRIWDSTAPILFSQISSSTTINFSSMRKLFYAQKIPFQKWSRKSI